MITNKLLAGLILLGSMGIGIAKMDKDIDTVSFCEVAKHSIVLSDNICLKEAIK